MLKWRKPINILMSSNPIEEASIAEENNCFELTKAQKQELDRRIQSLQENPDAGRSWEEIKSEFLNSK